MMKGMLTAIGTLIIVVAILYLAYVATKYIGKGVGLKTRSGCMQIKDQLILGKDRSAAIVQIGTRFFLIGIAGTQISFLSELDEDDLVPLAPIDNKEKTSIDFKDILDKMGRGKKNNG